MTNYNSKSTYTLFYEYSRLQAYINHSNRPVLGLGVDSWSIGGAPPTLDPNLTAVPGLFLYYPVTNIYVGQTSSYPESSASISVNGTWFEPQLQIPGATEYELLYTEFYGLGAPHVVYLETNIKHNLLGVPHFNIVGVYNYVHYANGVDTTQETFTPDQLTQAVLNYVVAYENITVQANLTQQIRIIIKP